MKRKRRNKKPLPLIYAAVFVGFFVFVYPFIGRALIEARGYFAIGGEVLIPLLIVLVIENARLIKAIIEDVKECFKND